MRSKAGCWLRALCSMLVVLWAPAALAALPSNLRFEHVRLLATDNVDALQIMQDRQGFIWVAGTGGLFRYDGYNSVRYVNDPKDPRSIPSSIVEAVFEDGKGRIWAGTRNGLARFDADQGRFTRFVPEQQFGDINQWLNVRRIIGDGKGGMWLGTRGGLQHFDPESGRFRIFRHDPARPDSIGSNSISALALGPDGGLWVGLWPKGLEYLAPGATGFRHYSHGVTALEQDPKSANFARALHFDRQKRLWICSDYGVEVWQTQEPWSERKKFGLGKLKPNIRAQAVMEDSESNIWIATVGEGLLAQEAGGQQLHNYLSNPLDPQGMRSNDVTTFFQDRNGVLWVATGGNGLERVDLKNKGLERILPDGYDPRNYFASGAIAAVQGDNAGHLWLGSLTGLYLFDLEKRVTLKHFSHDPADPHSLANDQIYHIYRDPGGLVWVGSRKGLSRLDPATGRFRNITFDNVASNYVSHIAPGRGGVFWLATGGGLIRYDPVSGAYKVFAHDQADPGSKSVDSSTIAYEDKHGRVWTGGVFSGAGLDILDQATGKFRHFRHDPASSTSLSNEYVSSLFEDARGRMWVGTDHGLNLAVAVPGGGYEFRNFTMKNGLAANEVGAGIFDSRGNLWVSTASGISHIELTSGKITNYYESDGLMGGSYHSSTIWQDGDTFYFSSSGGITALTPEKVHANTTLPQVAISDISVLNKSLGKQLALEGILLEGSITEPKALTLPWSASVFSLEFSALHFSDPSRNRYAYQLLGFDKDWVEADSYHRLATYTNLNPGHYVFRVKAANKSGVWNEDGITLPITITPPYWQTWWFRGLAVFLGVSLVALAYWWRISQLKAIQGRLEHMVSEKTEEYLEARDLALAASKVKSEFLANMSHEIRTPMNAIMGMTHLALLADPSPKLRGYLEKIDIAVKSLLGIINDILDFSKIEAHKVDFERAVFSIRDAIGNLIELMAEQAGNKGLELMLELDGNIPASLVGDEMRLRQILLNLLSNAIKFTDSGKVVVHAALAEAGEDSLLLRFDVSDSGIGMSEENLARLFTPFMQADSSTTRRFGGSGLGLSISHGLVQAMGGEIWAESEPGVGSTFSFTVRLGRFMERAAPGGPVPEGLLADRRGAPAAIVLLDGTRLLLAEDNEFNRQVARELLEAAGVVVTLARDGSEALERVRMERFDCILMDLQMPVMDGYEAAQRIHEDPLTAHIPIIAMTGNVTHEDRDRCMAAGMVDYITKPVQPARLYDTVARWAGKATVRRAEQNESSQTTAPGELLDLEVLSAYVNGDADKIRRYSRLFIEFANESLGEMEAALQRDDLAELARIGHRLRSSALTVGAARVAACCEMLERAETRGRDGAARDVAEIGMLVQQIANVLQQRADAV